MRSWPKSSASQKSDRHLSAGRSFPSSGEIAAISISQSKGGKKKNIPSAMLKENFGMINDAHAGEGDRQISLLAMESILALQAKGMDVHPGDFAENLTVQGLELQSVKKGDRLKLGEEVILEISQRGKTCHSGCDIFRQVGSCIMPKEGVFARVIKGGRIKVHDSVVLLAG